MNDTALHPPRSLWPVPLRNFLLLCAVVGMLAACAREDNVKQETGNTLATIDRPQAVDLNPQEISFQKTTTDIRKAYESYLNQSSITDNMRVNALSRLAELEYNETIKHLNAFEADPDNRNLEDRYLHQLEKTIRLLETAIDDYPKARANDKNRYLLAKAYDQQGSYEKTIETLGGLAENYPRSRYYVETQFRIAEDAFSRGRYDVAEEAYTDVILSPENEVFYEKALFKRGWSRYKQEYYEDAIDDFIELIEYRNFDDGYKLNKSDKERFDEYFRSLGLCFIYQEDEDALNRYFEDNADYQYIFETYSAVSDIFLHQERYTDAVTILEDFTRLHPDSDKTPYADLKKINIWKNSGYINNVYASVEGFYTKYNPSSEYWKDINENSRVSRTIRRSLREYIVLMSGYYHSRFQTSKKPQERQHNHDETEKWYRRYLEHYASYAQQDKIHYLYGEFLAQNKRYEAAFEHYQMAAYDNEIIVDKEAAYASIITSDILEKQYHDAGETKQAQAKIYLNKHIDYALKFSRQYPDDKRTVILAKHAAELAFRAKRYKTAIELADIILAASATGGKDKVYIRSIKAESYAQLGEYAEAEKILGLLLTGRKHGGKQQQAFRDRLALSIYKQGEQARENGRIAETIQHFSRIIDVAPQSKIAETGLYDAIALNMQHQQWPAAIKAIKTYQKHFPRNKRRDDIAKKLSVAYLNSNQGIQAARIFESISGSNQDRKVKSAALWQAGELYEEKDRLKDAIRTFRKYVSEYRKPFEQNLDAMDKLVKLYERAGNVKNAMVWRRKIVSADDKALNNAKTDRTRYLVSTTLLALANQEKSRFDRIKLTLPLKRSLLKKKKAMQQSVKLYGKSSQYKLFESATEATYSIAMIYKDFSHALLESERPKNLSEDELDQYEILLEDQAFPFEDKAIEFFEINLSRIKDGFYNDWIRKTHQELIKIFPLRYDRKPKIDMAINRIH